MHIRFYLFFYIHTLFTITTSSSPSPSPSPSLYPSPPPPRFFCDAQTDPNRILSSVTEFSFPVRIFPIWTKDPFQHQFFFFLLLLLHSDTRSVSFPSPFGHGRPWVQVFPFLRYQSSCYSAHRDFGRSDSSHLIFSRYVILWSYSSIFWFVNLLAFVWTKSQILFLLNVEH